MIYAIILAGGMGERFWPVSRENKPKQFHNIDAQSTMFQNTIGRVNRLIPAERIYVATNRKHRAIITGQLRKSNIPKQNLLFEPSPKNTLAPIGFISNHILKRDPQAIIVVLPSDHIIDKEDRFINVLKAATALAQKDFIITLGVRPTRPETGYGYIKLGPKIPKMPLIYRVEKFTEKPDIKKARVFLKSRNYLWNCGIFIFKAKTMMDEINRYAPGLWKKINKVRNLEYSAKIWNSLPSLSIDYGVMEHTKNAAVIVVNHGWTDIGNWLSFAELFKKDKSGNVLEGNVLDIGSRNIIVLSDEKLVATLGLKDIIVVNAGNATLVCGKNSAQDVKKIVSLLKKRKG